MSTIRSAGRSEVAAAAPADGFGAGPWRWWRRSAGAGVVSLLALGFGMLATGLDGDDRDSGFWALLVVACTWLGVPVSRWTSGQARGAALVARHAWSGTVLGLVAAVALSLWFGSGLGLLVVVALVALPAGALVGAATAALALLVPRLAAPVVAVLGVVAVGLLALHTFRAPPPYDLVAVDDTGQVSAVGGATGLAALTQDAVERAGSGGDLRAAPLWQTVPDLFTAVSDARPASHSADVDDLPVARATGERVRLVTVRVRDRASACVVVEARTTRVLDGACEDLDLVR
ncbi:hypothetical protein [Kineococcus rubinsiae]|uniref:hypothetical protein n=1 Tax=Kineococcus rubinsiae TaxID=2609562 RepID=UPI001431E303|nr:hypothetical protein [Kineococcus rubinsiae]NIZ92988.1 hypothetical protein [Kineococcus rubinsiae]